MSNFRDHNMFSRRSLRVLKRKLLRKISFIISSMRLRKIDDKSIPKRSGELRLFAMARNESLRLPYFLEYYFKMGVDRVFLIDNGSTDNTREIALSFDNVHILQTSENFKNYSNWMEIALDRYGKNGWCISADIDEIFKYPNSETISIKQLCEYLEQQGETAVQSLLLDMYSDKPIRMNSYKPGQDPSEVCPYFDVDFEESVKVWINQRSQKEFHCMRFSGGMRKRLFNADVSMSKIPLFKYTKGVFAGRGMHGMDGVKFSEIRGVVMHFKYLQDFNQRVVSEVERGQHEGGAADYKLYANKVNEDADLNCYSDNATKYVSTAQLVELGLMKTSLSLEEFMIN